MDRWTFRGLLHNNTAATWGPTAAAMNFWCPDAVWDPVRRRVVLYFTNQGVGGGGGWGVATSADGGAYTELMGATFARPFFALFAHAVFFPSRQKNSGRQKRERIL